jgi:hypothetical protein
MGPELEPEQEAPGSADGWWDDFAEMADEKLGDGSACQQIHPVVEKWFHEWLNSDIPAPRSAIAQATACLATEVLNDAPESIINVLTEHCDEETVYQWVQNILATGQAFQMSLDNGRLDDL